MDPNLTKAQATTLLDAFTRRGTSSVVIREAAIAAKTNFVESATVAVLFEQEMEKAIAEARAKKITESDGGLTAAATVTAAAENGFNAHQRALGAQLMADQAVALTKQPSDWNHHDLEAVAAGYLSR